MSTSARRRSTLIAVLLLVCGFVAGVVVSSSWHLFRAERMQRAEQARDERAESILHRTGEFAAALFAAPTIHFHASNDHPSITRDSVNHAQQRRVIAVPKVTPSLWQGQFDDPRMPIRNAKDHLRSEGFSEPQIKEILEQH